MQLSHALPFPAAADFSCEWKLKTVNLASGQSGRRLNGSSVNCWGSGAALTQWLQQLKQQDLWAESSLQGWVGQSTRSLTGQMTCLYGPDMADKFAFLILDYVACKVFEAGIVVLLCVQCATHWAPGPL